MAQDIIRYASQSRAIERRQMHAVVASPSNRVAAARSGLSLYSAFQSGQVLAGTGALVFEGEILDQPRCH
ncbi:MAG: hypothetical protein KDJ48_05090 [Nitratireductor sp.]|nr:hypothetical protein [Nitratireductor sp.]MCB1458628.1 hypothetical protein [Nitratireductor sp.]